MNVAVTGVGGGVGQSIIKALQDTDYRVIGIDGELYGTGLYAASKSYLGYYAKNSKFIDRIIEICKKENCKVLFPGLDAELPLLSKQRNKLKENGILPVVSNPEVIRICDDKLATSRFLKKINVPYVRTYQLKKYAYELDFPVVLKPRREGHRSVGIYIVRNKREFNRIKKSVDIDNYLVQAFIEGDEYTCGSVSFNNSCTGVILMKRILRSGDTYKAFVVKDDNLSRFVMNVINKLGVFGAVNVQFRIHKDTPYIFEINARCSGTTASRALAGFNEPRIICDYIFKNMKKPRYHIEEIVILRYWKELVVSYSKIDEMNSNGFIANKAVKL